MSKPSEEYNPPFLLKSGHINTIYPNTFRKNAPLHFVRDKITTPDEDFLHVDTIRKGHSRLCILCHGLEGSSSSKYIHGTSSILAENNWDIAAINYRSCCGAMNLQKRLYHSGATDDLHTVINHYLSDYDEIALVGFSLGGNLVLKYLGEDLSILSSKISCATAISVPTNLEAGCVNIGKPSNFIYANRFLVSLKAKLLQKKEQHPDIDISKLNTIKTLFDFDDNYTGPIHGFENATDYYTQCSSAQFLKFIDRPTLILNALDDPFLPEECYPYDEVAHNKQLTLLTPKYGGHVGWVEYGKKYYWDEIQINRYLSENSFDSSER